MKQIYSKSEIAICASTASKIVSRAISETVDILYHIDEENCEDCSGEYIEPQYIAIRQAIQALKEARDLLDEASNY